MEKQAEFDKLLISLMRGDTGDVAMAAVTAAKMGLETTSVRNEMLNSTGFKSDGSQIDEGLALILNSFIILYKGKVIDMHQMQIMLAIALESFKPALKHN